MLSYTCCLQEEAVLYSPDVERVILSQRMYTPIRVVYPYRGIFFWFFIF